MLWIFFAPRFQFEAFFDASEFSMDVRLQSIQFIYGTLSFSFIVSLNHKIIMDDVHIYPLSLVFFLFFKHNRDKFSHLVFVKMSYLHYIRVIPPTWNTEYFWISILSLITLYS